MPERFAAACAGVEAVADADRGFGGATRFLVSFCNVRGEARGGPQLAFVTLRGEERQVCWIHLKKGTLLGGATGLCLWNGMVCATHQGGPETRAGFVILDPARDFEAVSEGRLPPDPHSVCSGGGDLYFAVTGRDRVVKASYDPVEERWRRSRHWTFPGSSGKRDENHVNAIGYVDGDLCVSGFERKRSDRWDSATRGFIYNIDQNDYVMRGIFHPHSLFYDSRTVWTCESQKNRLISRDGDKLVFPSSYLRGLAMDEDHIYVGSSKRRPFSKSTGKPNPKMKRRTRGSCCVYRLAKGAKEPEMIIDFSRDRDEIYDVLLMQGTRP